MDDGVNIAARLEGISKPGGICVSGTANDHVHTKLSLAFTDLGDHKLKNIERPVRVYRIGSAPVPSPVQARPALSLPDKPSIAVLPFTNLSGDPREDYFSDGITEDIITELFRFSELFVIARNSSFQYKGKSPDIRQVGRELGVSYVLEWSIRRAGDRVRITGQLIDATTGAHRWAERYDRELKDVFAVQDEVARTIVALIAAHVNKAQAERTLLKPPAIWQAYDYYLKAADSLATFFAKYDVNLLCATRLALERSIMLDAKYARAHAMLSFARWIGCVNRLDADYHNPSALEEAYQLARAALQLDSHLSQAQAQLGLVMSAAKALDRFDPPSRRARAPAVKSVAVRAVEAIGARMTRAHATFVCSAICVERDGPLTCRETLVFG